MAVKPSGSLSFAEALNDTLTWERSSPFLNAAAAGLGMTDEQLDALFIQAAGIAL